MTRVKLIFTYSVSETDLLSTYSRANSLGGRQILTQRAFTPTFSEK